MTTDPLPGILAIFNNVAPGRDAEFDHWFQSEHLAERIAVPGFLLGRRYEILSGQPRFFNFYLTQSAAVLKSTAYLSRLDNPTPMTRMVIPVLGVALGLAITANDRNDLRWRRPLTHDAKDPRPARPEVPPARAARAQGAQPHAAG